MRNKKLQAVIKAFAFIILSFNVNAQPDLTFNSASTLAVYSAVEFQLTPVVIDFEVQNIGNLDAGDGISFLLNYNDLEFGFNGGLSTFSASWNCTPQTGGLFCSYFGNLAVGTSEILNLAFDIGSTTPVMQYNFNGSLTDVGAVETVTTNNSISTIVDLMAVGVPDLTLVGGITPLNFTFTENDTTPQSVSYRVLNNGADATLGVDFAVVYDDLNFSVIGPTSAVPAGWNCVPTTGVVTCSTTNNFAALAVADFTFDFAVLSSPAAPVGNYPNILSGNLQDPSFSETNLTDNVFSSNVTVNAAVAQTDLELLKFAKDGVGGSIIADIPIDTQFVYSIQVNNLSTTAATNVVVTDNIPAGIEITSAAQSTGSWSCSIAAFVDNFTSQLVTCNHPTIAASQPSFSEVIYLDAFGRVSSPTALSNTASVSATETDSNTGNNMDFAAISINPATPSIDVFVTKTFDSGFNLGAPVTVVQGQQATYKVLADASSGAASNVVLTDVLPAGITYVSHQVIGPNFTCAFDGVNTVSCMAPSLPVTAAADGVLITVVADGAVASIVNNIASISADLGSNANLTNDTSSAGSFTIVAPAVELDLTITKDAQLVGSSISNNNFVIGQNFEYKLVAINQNGNMAQAGDVLITDALPTGINLDAVPASAGWDCSATSGTSVSCINTVPIAANGGSLELIVPVSSLLANTYSNTANVSVPFTSTAFETFTSDNSANFGVTVVNTLTPTTLSVSKDALVSGNLVTVVNSGSNYTYRIAVTNTGNDDAINVVAIDMFPTGVNVNTTSGSGWSCTNTGPQYTCNFPGPLTPGSSTFVDLNVTEATAAGTQQILNNVDVSADNAPLQTASNTINVVRPTLNVRVTQNPDPIVENSPFEITIEVVNTGNSSLSGIKVDNYLPAGFSYSPTTKQATNCTQNGNQMSCAFTNPIPPGTSGVLVIPVQAVAVFDPNIFYSNATVVSGPGISIPITKLVTFNVIASGIDVAISKFASVSAISPNGAFNYILSVENSSIIDVTGLTVIDNLPTGVQLVSINAPDWSCVGTSQVSCTSGSLAAGLSSDIILNVIAPSVEGVINNTAQISILEQDTNTSNDISSASVNVMNGSSNGPAIADLELTKTTSSPTLISGEQYSWVINVLNHGPDVANNVVVFDLIPEGFEFESATVSSGVCQNTLTDITCEIPFIFNQDTVSIEVLGIASIESGELSSIATVTADSTDPVSGNNSGSVNVIVNPVPFFEADLAVSIDAGDAIDQGAVTELTVNVFNNGPDTANPPDLNIAVTGLLDSVTFNPGSDWSCQEAGFVVSCHFNGTVIDNGQMSSVGLTVNTTQVVLDAQDVMVTAMVSTTETDVDSNLDNNTATAVIGVAGTPTEGVIGDALRDALGGSSTGDPILDNAIDAVSGYCEVRYYTALEGLCDSLYNSALAGDRDAIDRFLRQITPNEVIGQSTSVAEIAGAQFRNIGSRLNQLRGGGGSGFSTAGLNARYGNGSIPLGMLAYLNQSENETDGLSKIPDDFITPWGFFVNGSISMGKRDATGKELGFDFDTYGLTAGFDYRLDAKKVIGIALGYANFDSDIDGAAKLKSTGVTLTGYGSFYVNDNFYIDARISYGKPKFDQSRNIDFTIGSTHIDRTAIGNTNANQYSFAMSAGYSFYKNAWNITPNATLSYVKTNIDSFTETGAGDFNVIYSEQQWDSLTWSAGLKVSKAISMKKGVITPQLDFDYNYESKNNGQDIIAHFINAPSDQVFIIETDSPDRTYGSAGLGLVYISANGKQAYINYRSVLGLEGFSRGTFNIGARFEF